MKKISLTRGFETIIDDCDYDELSKHKWYPQINGHRKYAINGEGILMHRLILNAPSGLEVDHIDGNGLNNTRQNLRLCTRSQNQFNKEKNKGKRDKCTSRYKGVHWQKSMNKWEVLITKEGDRTIIGYFDTEEEAARAYDVEAKELHGEFAYLNFPWLDAEIAELIKKHNEKYTKFLDRYNFEMRGAKAEITRLREDVNCMMASIATQFERCNQCNKLIDVNYICQFCGHDNSA